jgi:phosphatidylglycerol---prolipoprotein diacylglyceryl transferase
VIDITINPYPLQWGSFALSWHGVFLALGVLVTCLLFFWLGKKQRLALADIVQLMMWIMVAGLVGARAVEVFGNWPYYRLAPGEILRIQDGGVSVTGAVLGGFLALFVYTQYRHLSAGRLADIFAFIAPVGLFVGRMGCLIMGDATGVPTHSLWGLVYWQPSSSIPPQLIGEPTFPAPIALQVLDILLLILALGLSRKSLRPGMLWAVFLQAYGLGRFLIGFWQLGSLGFLGLHFIQWVVLIISSVGFILMVIILWMAYPFGKRRKGRDSSDAQPPAPKNG